MKKFVVMLFLSVTMMLLSLLGVVSCIHLVEDEEPPPPTPNWGAWEVTTLATCLEYGEETRVCQNDASVSETRAISPLGHDFAYLFEDKNILMINHPLSEVLYLYNALNDEFNVDVKNIDEVDSFSSIDNLKQWHMIILVGVNYHHMPSGFIQKLYSFVYDYGNSVLTIGNRGETEDNLFNQMLPFNFNEFVPPLALVIAIDRSGSMHAIDRIGSMHPRMHHVRQAAISVVEELNPWDYVSIVSFSGDARIDVPLRRVGDNRRSIIGGIYSIMAGGAAHYAPALRMAEQILRDVPSYVVTKNIMFIVDGEPMDGWPGIGPTGLNAYGRYLNMIGMQGIGLYIVAIAYGDWDERLTTLEDMVSAVNQAAGGVALAWQTMIPADMMEYVMLMDLMQMQNRAIVDSNLLFRIENNDGQELEYIWLFGGDAKEGADVLIRGPAPFYINAYIEWEFGSGRVGGFMAWLFGELGRVFLQCELGREFMIEMIKGLMPTHGLMQVCARCGYTR